MRSLIASFVLGLGALGASAALPAQSQAADHWQGRHSYGGYNRYYGPGYGYIPPVVSPVMVPPVMAPVYVPAPVVRPRYVAPYASFSIGWGPAYYRGGYYGNYRGGNYGNYRGHNHHHH